MKNNRIPKGFSVCIHADDSVHIIVDNYDGNFLAFQILILGIPLFIACIVTALYASTAFFIFFLLLAAVAYWCVYNYKDKSRFIFTKDCFYVLEGLHQVEKMKVRPVEVLKTEKTKNAGRTLTSARTYNTAKTKPTYQLYIITSEEKMLVTKHVGPTGQEYLDEAIKTWLVKCA